MRLIEDLGMQEYGTQGKKTRFGLYECPNCGEHFKCTAYNVKSGHTTKCRACSRASLVQKASDIFSDMVSKIHSNKYDYSLAIYRSANTKVLIICPDHGEFWQAPKHHKNGAGCPTCANERASIARRKEVSSGKLTTLYYVYFVEYNLWKIGCTELEVEDRFKNEKTVLEILAVKTYIDSREAYFVEDWVLKATLTTKSKITPLKSGNTELRAKPITGLLDLVKEAEGYFRG